VKILVEGIPSAGVEVTFGLGDKKSWAIDAATTALDRPPTRLSGKIELNKASDKGVVMVTIRAEAAGDAVCDRCAEAFELETTAASSNSRPTSSSSGGTAEASFRSKTCSARRSPSLFLHV
jgi:hypothetical protein